jgi:hypothetical protein
MLDRRKLVLTIILFKLTAALAVGCASAPTVIR